MATREESVKKCYDLYLKNLDAEVDVLDTLVEARSFVYNNTESWYYAGHELLGRLDAAIRVEKIRRGLPI